MTATMKIGPKDAYFLPQDAYPVMHKIKEIEPKDAFLCNICIDYSYRNGEIMRKCGSP